MIALGLFLYDHLAGKSQLPKARRLSAQDPSKATREYAIHRTGKLVTVLGGKWTTALALADKVSLAIH